MEKIKLYLWLARVNLAISAFTFGGGYVVVPMIRKYFVEEKNLFDQDDLMAMAAIAQSAPGAIAINLSVLAGKKSAGLPGIIISLICSITPPIVILAFISNWYQSFSQNQLVMAVLRGMQACVAAMMVDFLIDMVQLIIKEKSKLLNLLMPLSFIGAAFLNINVIVILLLASGICLVAVWKRREAVC